MRLCENKSVCFLFLGAIVAASPASGNDSTATLGAGGLELTSSDEITMESENLFLSPKEARVHYVFRNESGKDITTRVAFPMPEVPFGPMDNVDLPDAGKENFVDFSVTVDGHAVKPDLEQRAISAPVETDGATAPRHPVGTDMTKSVVEAGLPINANLPAWKKKLADLPADARKRLIKEGVLFGDSSDGAVDGISPQWSLRETYHWEQTYPAGKPIVVEHRYRPVVGSSFFTGEHGDLDEIRSAYGKQYCLDQAGMAGVLHLLKKAAAANAGGGNNYLFADDVAYILTTGANWKGEIGDFRMTLDKIHADAVLSTCADGIKKTGPTTFEVQRGDFTPKQDVRFVVFRMGGT